MGLPIRLRIENFRRFERLIGQYVSAYPEPMVFQVPGMAPETVVCRMRDAISGFLKPENVWHSNFFSKETLSLVWETSTLSHDGHKIRFGPKVRNPLERLEGSKIAVDKHEDQTQETLVDRPSDMDVQCLVYLLGRGIITGMYRLKFSRPDIVEHVRATQSFPPNVEVLVEGSDLILL